MHMLWPTTKIPRLKLLPVGLLRDQKNSKDLTQRLLNLFCTTDNHWSLIRHFIRLALTGIILANRSLRDAQDFQIHRFHLTDILSYFESFTSIITWKFVMKLHFLLMILCLCKVFPIFKTQISKYFDHFRSTNTTYSH